MQNPYKLGGVTYHFHWTGWWWMAWHHLMMPWTHIHEERQTHTHMFSYLLRPPKLTTPVGEPRNVVIQGPGLRWHTAIPMYGQATSVFKPLLICSSSQPCTTLCYSQEGFISFFSTLCTYISRTYAWSICRKLDTWPDLCMNGCTWLWPINWNLYVQGLLWAHEVNNMPSHLEM